MIRWRNIFAAQAALSLRTDIDTLVLRQAPRKHRASVGAHNCHERRVTYFRGWLALITISGRVYYEGALGAPLTTKNSSTTTILSQNANGDSCLVAVYSNPFSITRYTRYYSN
jgi:hypothetical protein